jgi:hypothetical protein
MASVPSVGRVVHYVSYGTPGGEYKSVCRAAVVAAVPTLGELGEEWDGAEVVLDLAVLNPTGVFFNRCGQDDQSSVPVAARLTNKAGTWHWPERES